VSVSVKQDGTGYIQTIVQDTGKGIRLEEQERIFDRFYQGGEDGGGRPGTGLGLSVTRELVCLQGGDIWVRSQVGVGSSFIFTLPEAEQQPDSGTPQPRRANAAGAGA
jgi:signal transduction histidine kinase